MKPRPWFLSLTAIWNDDADAAQHLDDAINGIGTSSLYPQHHIAVRSDARHLTIFAILRVNSLPSAFTNFRDFTRDLMSSLTSDSRLLDQLTQHFGSGLSLDAYELRIFDSGAAIQFHGSSELAAFRDAARVAMSEPVLQLVSEFPEGIIDPLVDDPAKSRGDHAFGSIARSPSRSDLSIERFRAPLAPPVSFKFRRIHFLASDDALTNPRILDAEDIIIGD